MKINEAELENLDEIFKKGYAFYLDANYEKAIKFISKSIKKEGEHYLKTFYSALSYLHQRKLSDAIQLFNKVLEQGEKVYQCLLNLASAYKRSGDYENALDSYTRLLKMDLDKTPRVNLVNMKLEIVKSLESRGKKVQLEDDYEKGLYELNSGRFDEAISHLNNFITKKPDFSYAYLYKSSAEMQIDKFENALESVEKFVELDPKDANGWIRKAVILSYLGEFERAIENGNRALELQPNSSMIKNQLNIIHQTQMESKLRVKKEKIEIRELGEKGKITCGWCQKEIPKDSVYCPKCYNPNESGISFFLGKNVIEEIHNKMKEDVSDGLLGNMPVKLVAQQYRDTIIKREEMDENYRKAEGLMEEKKFEEATIYWKKLLNTHPKPHIALFSYIKLAFSYFNFKYDYAISPLDKALMIMQENHPYQQDGRKTTLKFFTIEETKERINTLENILFIRGTVLGWRKQFQMAINNFEILLEVQPNHEYGWLYKGYLHNDIREYDKALECFDKALEVNPNDSDAKEARMNLLKKTEKMGIKLKTAISKAKAQTSQQEARIILQNPSYIGDVKKVEDMNDPKEIIDEGYILYRAGRFQQALEYFNAALELDPKNRSAWDAKIKSTGNLKQFDKTIELYHKVLEIFPDDAHFWYDVGVWYRRRQQPDKAIEYYEKVIELDKDNKSGGNMDYMAWDAMGNAYYDMKEYNKAIEAYKKVIQHEKTYSDSSAHTKIGDLYLEMNNIDEAIKNYEKALKFERPDRRALDKLNKLKKKRF